MCARMRAVTGGLPAARALLEARFGYPRFRTAQLRVLGPLLGGADVVAVLPTGAGKSLCYQVPALLAGGLTLVVSPLISLMQDQVGALRRRGVAAAFLSSTLTTAERDAALRAAVAGALTLLYCAPERLASLVRLLSQAKRRVTLLAVDEAHCIVEWGNEFRPVYRELGRFRAQLGNPLTIALTGSATAAARAEIRAILGLEHAVEVLASFDRPNLRFAVERVRDDVARFARLRELLTGDGTSLVYAPTRRLTELITRALLRIGARVGPYHAGLSPEMRRSVLDTFLAGSLRLVVATSAFGMGIDKPDVRRVVHWGPPRTLEGYYQEAGRAGRDGGVAACRILWRPEDLHWGHVTPPMRDYLLGRTCRRRALLAYFGERLERCAGCDVCGT